MSVETMLTFAQILKPLPINMKHWSLTSCQTIVQWLFLAYCPEKTVDLGPYDDRLCDTYKVEYTDNFQSFCLRLAKYLAMVNIQIWFSNQKVCI